MTERTVFQSMPHKRVVSVPPHATIREAARVMTRASCGSVLVLEPPDLMLGILTERDLMTRVLARDVDPDKVRVTEVMTRKPVCVPPETLVSEAIVIMLERGFRHLPVVGAQGRILGVFSARDALPREIGTALDMTEFKEQVNDALG